MSNSNLRKKMACGGGAVILALGLLVLSLAGCASGSTPATTQGTLTTTTSESSEAQSSLLNTVTVSGTGQMSALPDQAVIYIGVQGSAATAAAALDANSKQMQKVLARLKADGVPESAIETTNVSVYPNAIYDQKTGKQTTISYQATNSVKVTLTDFTVIGPVFAATAETGANNISGPTWQLSDNTQAQTEALAKASANARAKAEAFAAANGVTLGKVLVLNEGYSSPVYYYTGEARASATTTIGAPPVSPQSLEVIISVTITYELKH